MKEVLIVAFSKSGLQVRKSYYTTMLPQRVNPTFILVALEYSWPKQTLYRTVMDEDGLKGRKNSTGIGRDAYDVMTPCSPTDSLSLRQGRQPWADKTQTFPGKKTPLNAVYEHLARECARVRNLVPKRCPEARPDVV